jgi:hypothetical protein
MGIIALNEIKRSNSESNLTLLKEKTNDVEFSRAFRLIRAFQLVTSERTPPTRMLSDIDIKELSTLDRKEISRMRILQVLETFECVRKKGATAADILYEATRKRQLKIMEPLLAKVSAEELNRGFELACAHASALNDKKASLEMIHAFLKDTRLSPSAIEKGFAIICNFGNAFLATELKYNHLLSQEAVDKGYHEAYQEKQHDIMEILKDKVSAQGVGQVFRKACQEGRRDIALKLSHHPRLKIGDLRLGLMAAEKHEFAGALRNALDFITRSRLFVRGHWGSFFMGGAAVGVAASLIYRNIFRSNHVTVIPEITKNWVPVKTIELIDDFVLHQPRCCSLIK